MGVNKIVYDGDTKIDLTQDTVSAETLLAGYTAHDCAGNSIVGTASSGGGGGGSKVAVAFTNIGATAKNNITFNFNQELDNIPFFVFVKETTDTYKNKRRTKIHAVCPSNAPGAIPFLLNGSSTPTLYNAYSVYCSSTSSNSTSISTANKDPLSVSKTDCAIYALTQPFIGEYMCVAICE